MIFRRGKITKDQDIPTQTVFSTIKAKIARGGPPLAAISPLTVSSDDTYAAVVPIPQLINTTSWGGEGLTWSFINEGGKNLDLDIPPHKYGGEGTPTHHEMATFQHHSEVVGKR
jgi:hypothetical protein